RAWDSPVVLGSLAGSAVILTGFALWERRSDHPMLPLGLFRQRRFSVAMMGMGFVLFSLMGGLFVLTQYLQFSLGYSALGAGLRVAPIAGVLLVAAPFSTILVRRFGTKLVVFVGMGMIAAGFVLLSRVTLHGTYLDALPAFVAIGVGVGLSMAPCTDSVMGSVPLDEAGVGSATNGASLQVGGALGVAVLGSLLNQHYRAHLGPQLAGLHLPRAISDLITGSLGGALAVAEKLGAPAATSLAVAAREAFLNGMDSAVLTGGLVASGGAVLVLLLLPARVEQEGAPAPNRPRAAAGGLNMRCEGWRIRLRASAAASPQASETEAPDR
ncbi:MAG: MFS transporter, partial [Actinomycetota bacterium]|nr:MFS transporter [Actinomycetota bacterium]